MIAAMMPATRQYERIPRNVRCDPALIFFKYNKNGLPCLVTANGKGQVMQPEMPEYAD
jgi:hypothetical protein